MFLDDDGSVFDQRAEILTQLAFGSLHHVQRAKLCGQKTQGGGVVGFGDDVANSDPARGLFEGEVTLICQHRRQLLLVVGPSRRLARCFDEHDAHVMNVSLQTAETLVELIVGDKPPAPGSAGRTLVLQDVQCSRKDRQSVLNAQGRRPVTTT